MARALKLLHEYRACHLEDVVDHEAARLVRQFCSDGVDARQKGVPDRRLVELTESKLAYLRIHCEVHAEVESEKFGGK